MRILGRNLITTRDDGHGDDVYRTEDPWIEVIIGVTYVLCSKLYDMIAS